MPQWDDKKCYPKVREYDLYDGPCGPPAAPEWEPLVNPSTAAAYVERCLKEHPGQDLTVVIGTNTETGLRVARAFLRALRECGQ